MARKKAPSRHSKQQPESIPRRPLPVLDADPGFGLSQAQVQARLASGWSNDPGESPSKSEGQIIRESYRRCRTTVAVAKDLGISQATAARKIAKYVGGRKE